MWFVWWSDVMMKEELQRHMSRLAAADMLRAGVLGRHSRLAVSHKVWYR